jgi:hypothetical protein
MTQTQPLIGDVELEMHATLIPTAAEVATAKPEVLQDGQQEDWLGRDARMYLVAVSAALNAVKAGLRPRLEFDPETTSSCVVIEPDGTVAVYYGQPLVLELIARVCKPKGYTCTILYNSCLKIMQPTLTAEEM